MLIMNFSHFLDIFAWPFGYVMQFFNWICQGNYAIALFLFALAVKLVTLPLSIKQQKTQIKGAMLRPKIALIEKKYAGRTDRTTLQKKQQEIMELQQKEGYSPFSGCLPLLIQLPVIFGLYRIIRMPLKYVCGLTDTSVVDLTNDVLGTTFEKLSQTQNSQINVISDLMSGNFGEIMKEYGLSASKLPNFELFGNIDLHFKPSFDITKLGHYGPNLWLLAIPVLCGVLSYLSMFISRKMNNTGLNAAPAGGDQKMSMTIMNLTMPLMSVWIAFVTSGVIGLYWVYTSLLGILQTVLLAKLMPLPTYTEEEIKQIQRAMKHNQTERKIVGTSVDANGKPKSLHYEDDDDQY